MNLEKVKTNLKRIREEQNLTIDELASISNVTSVTIRNIEKGRFNPNPKTVNKLAIALDVDFDDLVE